MEWETKLSFSSGKCKPLILTHKAGEGKDSYGWPRSVFWLLFKICWFVFVLGFFWCFVVFVLFYFFPLKTDRGEEKGGKNASDLICPKTGLESVSSSTIQTFSSLHQHTQPDKVFLFVEGI